MLKYVAAAMCAGVLACGCTALRVGDPPAPRPMKAETPATAQAAPPVAAPPAAAPRVPAPPAPSQSSSLSPLVASPAAPPAAQRPPVVTDDDVIIDDTAPRLPLVGGYAAADPDDVGANAAQTIALNEIMKRDPSRALVENVTRELQVVAGLNYRFVVSLSGGARYRVVVYRPLQGDMRVTEYEKLS